MAKERDFILDAFRGILIWAVVFFHFVRIGGHFSKESLSGVVYLCVCIFIMEAFMFVTGYFSKNPEKSKKNAFKTFLMPYIILIMVSYWFRYWYFGNANLNFFTPPFALWFLFVAFLYKYFLPQIVRVKYLFVWAIALYLIAGRIEWLGTFLGLGRAINYFPYFLLGYYCTKEHIDKVRSIKKWQTALIGIFAVGASTFLALCIDVPIGWYLMRDPAITYNLTWQTDLIMKILVPLVSLSWMVFLMNIIPNRETYLSYVGRNTMSIYALHIFIRYVLKHNGVPIDNQVIYVVAMFALASAVVVVLSAPPVVKVYNFAFDGIYKIYDKIKHVLLKYPEGENA